MPVTAHGSVGHGARPGLALEGRRIEGRGPPPLLGRERAALSAQRLGIEGRVPGRHVRASSSRAVDRTRPGLELGEVGQMRALAAEVTGRVDDRLDPQRPAVLQVLLDPGVLVEDVDRITPPLSRRSIAVRKTPWVSRRILRAKMISTLCGRPMSRLSAISASKKPRACRGAVEDDGAGDLHLPHRDLPPVAGVMVPGVNGNGSRCQPPLGEHVGWCPVRAGHRSPAARRGPRTRRTRWTARCTPSPARSACRLTHSCPQ